MAHNDHLRGGRVLVLVRHARSEANVAEIIDTALPGAPLAEEGRARARDLADRLADPASTVRAAIGATPARIWHSAAHQATETAAAVASRLELAPAELEGVQEIFGGDLEGTRRSGRAGALPGGHAPLVRR